MRRKDYTSIAGRVEYPGVKPISGKLQAGKSNGATYLDIGGEVNVSVKESRDGEVTIHFVSDDGTRGELTLDADELRDELRNS